MKQLFIALLILITSTCYSQHKYIIKVKDNGKPTDLSSKDYPNDSVAVTDGHLSQWDFYRTGNIVKVVTSVPSPNYDFYFTVNTADSMDAVFEMMNTNASFTANVNWGDGTNDNYTSTDIIVHHTYSSVGDYKITITFPGPNNLTNFEMNISMSQNMTSIHNLDKLTQLDAIEVFGSKMTNIDTLHYPAALRYIELDRSSLTSFNPTSLPPILKSIDLNNSNNLTSFSMPVPTSTFLQLQLDHGNLSVTQVNNILTFLNANTNWPGIEVYLQSQQTPAPPSGAGLTAKNSLITKGDSVSTD